ncbi:MAG: DNA primase [Acetobacter papayae]|uniref:DNA primase n=1 Tax=Acetobacter papayae TaxID=1076592 RepID=UPI0039EAC633
MAIDAGFLDELRARTPIASVIGRRVKLTRSGRNWKGCCPFHGEKTPSFYVYDDHFHCFGCGVHGDVISFVMQSEGRSFPEAVEELASSAGLEVPAQTRESREAVVHARSLEDVLNATQALWAQALYQPEGRAGLDYLLGRGLTRETIASFGLGWAGEGRGALAAVLEREGITPVQMAEAGLMRLDEDGRPKGELFWGRVTFPIRDRKGRLVSFGGRILGDGQPKYLNGPETALFSKRRLLFGLDRARAAIRAPRPKGVSAPDLVVVEGYMDVIALHQAGFTGAVAPLGTALTPEQLEVLWQVDRAPILCFDGDAAGRRAAVKAAQTALPLLKADHTLRFCLLPEGEDPDSLVRGRGAQAVAGLFGSARGLSDVLFDLLAGGMVQPGPEERAALRHKLTESAALITDKALASEYRRTLLDHFFTRFRSSGRGKGGGAPGGRGGGWQTEAGPTTFVLLDQTRERHRLLLSVLLRYPALVPDVEEALCRLDLAADFAAVRAALLDFSAEGIQPASAAALWTWVTQNDLEETIRAFMREEDGYAARSDDVMDPAQLVSARTQWWHFYGLLDRARFEAEVERDIASFTEKNGDADQWTRLQARLEARERLRRGSLDDTEF